MICNFQFRDILNIDLQFHEWVSQLDFIPLTSIICTSSVYNTRQRMLEHLCVY